MKISEHFTYADIQGFKFGYWPFGQPRLFVYAYFVDGLLIDTGQSNMRAEVVEALSPLPIKQIFLTHHHEDHTGNVTALQKHFSCPVYASARCCELMRSPPSISPAQWLTWGRSTPTTQLRPIAHTLCTERYQFELIPIPGHAEDMLGLYEASQGWFFSADLFVNEYIRFFMRSESMRTQIASIEKVLQLDFKELLCSHNPQLQDGKAKLLEKQQFLQDFYGEVSKLYHEGYGVAAICKTLPVKRSWSIRLLSLGELSAINMVKSVIRDEQPQRAIHP